MKLSATNNLFPQEGLLMREISHRVVNEFSSIASMLSLAAARSDSSEVKTTLRQVSDRLERYIRVHRALQMPTENGPLNAASYLREICRSISNSRLAEKQIKLTFVENSLQLEAVHCWILGMAVYELINNAARHAFNECGGEIRVELFSTGNLAECRVSDDGIYRASGPRKGRGLRIIAELVGQLNGRFEQEFRDIGSISFIRFPVHKRTTRRGGIELTHVS